MRLKVFTAANISTAMAGVRRELGDDAIIISTEATENGSVTVTAAVEPGAPEPADTPAPQEPPGSDPDMPDGLDPAELDNVVAFHRAPESLADRLLRTARAMDAEDGVMALSNALEMSFSFSPLPERPRRPLLLAGPPGSGKSIAVAKLAARAVLAGHDCLVITTDTLRAGGVAQMSAFGERLQQPVVPADDPDALRTVIRTQGRERVVLIDTMSINPFKQDERDMIARYIAAAEAEPVFALPAGTDPADGGDMAAALGDLGIRRLLGTRLDTSRRLGALLAAAESGGFAFSDVTTSPFIGEGLDALNPVSFARLMVHCSGTKSTVSNPRRAAQ